MRGRIVFLISLFSMLLLIGFGLSDTSVESRRINFQPTKTPLPNNKPVDVVSVTFDKEAAYTFCPFSVNNAESVCIKENSRIKVSTTVRDEENDVVIYDYKVSAGRIVGQGAKVFWDFTGVAPGIYTIEVRADDGCGFCGNSVVKTFEFKECPSCQPAPVQDICPTMSVEASAASVKAGERVTFTAKLEMGTASVPIKYNWTISGGTIVEGQKTSEIKVKTDDAMSGRMLTATVEIDAEGMLVDCARTASKSVRVKK